MLYLTGSDGKKLRCSKCGRELPSGYSGQRMWCRKCETLVCNRCLKVGNLCPSCRIRTVQDAHKLKGIILIVIALTMGAIFFFTFFAVFFLDSHDDSLSDYDPGDVVVLTGPIVSGDDGIIIGKGLPGNVTWDHPEHFIMQDERDNESVRVVIGSSTWIFPCHMVPEWNGGPGVFEYSYDRGDRVVVRAVARLDDDDERYYDALDIFRENGKDIPGGYEEGEMVLFGGELETVDGKPLQVKEEHGNLTWNGSGVITVHDERGSFEVNLSGGTILYMESKDGVYVKAEFDDTFEIDNETGIRILALPAENSSEGVMTFRALEIFFSAPEDGSYSWIFSVVMGGTFGIMALAFLVAVLILFSISGKREKKHRERSMTTAVLATISRRVEDDILEKDMEWFDNGALARYNRNLKWTLFVLVPLR